MPVRRFAAPMPRASTVRFSVHALVSQHTRPDPAIPAQPLLNTSSRPLPTLASSASAPPQSAAAVAAAAAAAAGHEDPVPRLSDVSGDLGRQVQIMSMFACVCVRECVCMCVLFSLLGQLAGLALVCVCSYYARVMYVCSLHFPFTYPPSGSDHAFPIQASPCFSLSPSSSYFVCVHSYV